MINLLGDLLQSDAPVRLLQDGLPYAFEIAEAEAGRVTMSRSTGLALATTGQEVGVHRERVIVGFLLNQLGEANVRLPEPGAPMLDVFVGDRPLEIKTVTGQGLVTAKWTSDNQAAENVLQDFEFTSDMLLVRIWWEEERDSVFYVPLEVLKEVAQGQNFLKSATGTNNRGVKIKNDFMHCVEKHLDTVRVSIPWRRSDAAIQSPIVRYTRYWSERQY